MFPLLHHMVSLCFSTQQWHLEVKSGTVWQKIQSSSELLAINSVSPPTSWRSLTWMAHLAVKENSLELILMSWIQVPGVLTLLVCFFLFDWQIPPSGSGGTSGFAGHWVLWGFSVSCWPMTITLWMWWLHTSSLHASFGGTTLWPTSKWVLHKLCFSTGLWIVHQFEKFS